MMKECAMRYKPTKIYYFSELKNNNLKPFRTITSTALFVLGVFFLVGYSACKKDSCKNVTCLNGGACQKGACVCPVGFTGTQCEKTTCTDVKCQNGGTCKDGACQCPTGYEGTYCEKLVIERFIGTWKGTTDCGSGSTSDATYVITKGVTDLDVVISETTFHSTKTLRGTVSDGKAIKVPLQSYSPPYMVEGTMGIDGGKLVFDEVNSSPSNNPSTCHAICTKQ